MKGQHMSVAIRAVVRPIPACLAAGLVAVNAFGQVSRVQDDSSDEIRSRARGAQRVVVATVVGMEPMMMQNAFGDRLIVSRTTLAVEEVFKGERTSTLTLDVEGGTLGTVTLEVSDMPSLTRGDRGIFFVDRSPLGVEVLHRRDRGLIRLEGDTVVDDLGRSSLTLDALRPALSGGGTTDPR